MLNNNNQGSTENMFRRRNYEHDESFSSSSWRYDDHETPQYYVDADDNTYIRAFGNLTLSDDYYSNPQEGRRPNRNQLSASSSEYLPRTVDDAPNSRTRHSFAQHNRGMPYYPAPSSYLRDQQPIGMSPLYSPNMWTAPVANLNSFAPRALSPNPSSYHNPNNPPSFPQADHTQITLGMLSHILSNPYEYMTTQTTSRPLSTLLFNSRRFSFIDDFVKAITKSQDSLIAAACNSYGTCVMQTLIKVAKKRPVIAHVPLLLADATVLLMTNPSGMHVVKQCFVELEAAKYRPLFEKMMENDNWMLMAVDKNGCRGLNDCIDYMVDSFKNSILHRIAENTQQLALDVYGNYVLQHVMDIDMVHTSEIVERILPILESLCTIKNGSHLLEKCLQTPYYSQIVDKLANSTKLVRFAIHECGNYVIQKAIIRTQQQEEGRPLYCKLVEELLKEKEALMVNRHGKYVAKLLIEHK